MPVFILWIMCDQYNVHSFVLNCILFRHLVGGGCIPVMYVTSVFDSICRRAYIPGLSCCNVTTEGFVMIFTFMANPSVSPLSEAVYIVFISLFSFFFFFFVCLFVCLFLSFVSFCFFLSFFLSFFNHTFNPFYQ